MASLARQYPMLNIIGEEGQSDVSSVPTDWIITEGDTDFLAKQTTSPESLNNVLEGDLVLWIDPLDGTAEYTQGLHEHVTVLIGLALNDRAIGGIIHQPFFNNGSQPIGRTIWGLKGLGCGGFTPIDPPADRFVVTTTRSHCTELVTSALNALNPDEIIRVGGAGYKVLQLLEGKAHAYVFASPGCKKWDTCAPEAVLEAHGGVLTDIAGEHYSYGKDVAFPNLGGVLGTAKGTNHQSVVDKIPNELKEKLKVSKL